MAQAVAQVPGGYGRRSTAELFLHCGDGYAFLA